MFNFEKSENNENSKKNNIKNDWLLFSGKEKNCNLVDSIASGNKFVEEEFKIRAVVVEMLDKEFGEKIRNIKGYDFLVDSVISKLKTKQLGSNIPLES